MAEKILNTRFQLKYDSYDNWFEQNPTLKAGEVAIAYIDAAPSQVKDENQALPHVLIKVGDGHTDYKTLPFVSGLAADVYSWAKAANKPTYAATEITGIDAYISEYVNEQMGISVDTDTQYQMVKVDDYNYKLQSKGKTDSAWADVEGSAIVIPNDTEAIEALQELVGNTAVNTQIANAIAALNLSTTYAPIEHTHEIAEVTGLENRLTALQGNIDNKQDALVFETAYNAENNKVATMSDVAAAVNVEKERAEGVESELNGKVTTLIGSDANKSVRTIANEELAAKLIAADADASLDTLQEIAQWIQDHPGDAAAMNDAITALQNQMNGIAAGTGTVKKYVDDAITALNVGQYALAADLLALAGRVETLEGDTHTHANKALLDTYTQTEANLADAVAKKHEHENASVLTGITAEKVAAWDAAEQNAKDYVDSELSSHEADYRDKLEKGLASVERTTDTKLESYVKKTDAPGYEDILTATVAGSTYETKGDASAKLAEAKEYTDDGITELDNSLHAIAKSGNVNDLVQTEGDVLVFYCGTASEIF